MPQETIGQRIKFLMDSLNLKVRTLASALDVSETNIRNYLSKDSKPSSDILERIVQQYPQVHAFWLLTGDGEPFILPTHESNQSVSGSQKFLRSPIVGKNRDINYQGEASELSPDFEAIRNKLALAEKEVEHLKAQLASKDDVIASKDAVIASQSETLTLLRGSFNRPN